MKVLNNQENFQKCICGACASHCQSMKDKMEGLYCDRGATSCEDLVVRDCMCKSCPVSIENGLEQEFSCLNGCQADRD